MVRLKIEDLPMSTELKKNQMHKLMGGATPIEIPKILANKWTHLGNPSRRVVAGIPQPVPTPGVSLTPENDRRVFVVGVLPLPIP